MRQAIEVEPFSSFLRTRNISGSPVVRIGDLLLVAGLPPFSPTGTIEPLTIERQAEIALDQMKLCVETAGSSLAKVGKCNIYADDAAHFDAINRVYNRYFPNDAPARIFLTVQGWPGPFNLEIDCIAAA